MIYMGRNQGMTILHATRPGRLPEPDTQKIKAERRQARNENPRKVTKRGLIRNYLCMGADSPCVQYRACECLDACRYGQKYIEMTGGNRNERLRRTD